MYRSLILEMRTLFPCEFLLFLFFVIAEKMGHSQYSQNLHNIMSTLILISWSTWHLKRTLNLFSRIESDIKYHFKDKEVYYIYKMILCFFIAALATVIECGVINTIDQGMLHSLMLHNFCYFKDKFFQLCIFFHEQISLPQQLLSSQEDESNTQILKKFNFWLPYSREY